MFKVGDKVDVAGTSNGKGFQGACATPMPVLRLPMLGCLWQPVGTGALDWLRLAFVMLLLASCRPVVSAVHHQTLLDMRHACVCLDRRNQALEPPQGQHDARLQIQAAAWLDRILRHAQPCAARPQNGWPDGLRAQDHQELAGVLRPPVAGGIVPQRSIARLGRLGACGVCKAAWQSG